MHSEIIKALIWQKIRKPYTLALITGHPQIVNWRFFCPTTPREIILISIISFFAKYAGASEYTYNYNYVTDSPGQLKICLKPYSSCSTVLIVNLIYFVRKQQGSSVYLIEIGGSSYTGMVGYLTAFQEMMKKVHCMNYMGYLTCIL